MQWDLGNSQGEALRPLVSADPPTMSSRRSVSVREYEEQ